MALYSKYTKEGKLEWYTDSPKTAIMSEAVEVVENSLSNKPSKKSFNYRIKRNWKPRLELKMKNWRAAVQVAEDPIRPRRLELYGLYNAVIEDDHYTAQRRTAEKTVLLSDFVFHKNDQPAEDCKTFFEKTWFREFVKIAIDTEFWGHSLIEFTNQTDNNGEPYLKPKLIWREHVRPETGEILLNVNDEKGIPYRKGALSKNLIELGEPEDIGLLKVISKTVIKKEYALLDWDRRNEKFGMPFLIVKTRTRDKKELDARADMAANFGANSWGIFDDMDNLEYLEAQNQNNAHHTFLDRARYADEKISMLVNGQTGTSDEKAFVGSAEVHERILNDYTLERLDRIESWINECLLPFLIKKGHTELVGATFHYTDLLKRKSQKDDNEETGMEKQKEPDERKKEEQPEQPEKPVAEKKKLSLKFDTLYNIGVECCDHELPKLTTLTTLSLDLGNIVQNAIKKVHQKKLKKGDIDADGWRYEVEQLWEATQKGVGQTILETEYSDPKFELMQQLKTNIHVFAAFKNHHRIAEMVDLLTGPGGNIREWKQFKEMAQLLNHQYFEDWLRAEYNTALSSAQMATKWQDFEKNKDILPMLQYITQADDRVRPAHQVLHKTTLPMDDPFWDEFYPPNGWNCRCTVLQVAGPRRDNGLRPSPEQTPENFRFNVGKSKELFPQTHSYFRTIPETSRQKLLEAVAPLVYDNYDKTWEKLHFNNKTNSYIVRHKNHTAHEASDNFNIALALNFHGKSVELLGEKPNQKNPDAVVSGLVTEFKTVTGKASLQKRIREGKKQASRILIALGDALNYTTVKDALWYAVMHDKNRDIKEIQLLKKGKFISIKREQIQNRKYENLLERFFTP